MSPLEFLGTLSMGIVLLLAIQGGIVAWACRNHRVDLSGIAIRREWTPFSDLEERRWREEHPILVAPKQTDFEGRTTEEAWAYANPGKMQHGARTEARGDDE